jgi:chromosome segregation ATPase
MPTQEERLTTLEQAIAASQKFQQQAAAHIRETEENTTILLGVIRSQGQDIKRIVQHLETIDERLETIDENIDQLKTTLNQQETTLNQLKTTLNEHTTFLTQILARLPKTP